MIADFTPYICLILNKVDTKSLKMYGETTPRKSLCEGL